MRKKTNKRQLFSNLLCCIMLAIPVAGYCQIDLNSIDNINIKIETSGADTIRYYYDEDDNKILHGKQVDYYDVERFFGEINSIKIKYTNYKHGILDGDFFWEYRIRNPFDENDKLKVEESITGSFTNGKIDGLWEKYSYSEKEKALVLERWERWKYGIMYGFYNGNANINFFETDLETAIIFFGKFIFDDNLLEVNEAGIVTNAFLRQNGEFEQFNEEMQKLMDRYLETGKDSVFRGTNYRLNTITITSPPFCDYKTISREFAPDSAYNKYYDNSWGYYPTAFKVHILTRIKYTPIEEIQEIIPLFTDILSLKSIRENLSFSLGERRYYISPIYGGKDDDYPFSIYAEPSYYYINPDDTTKLDEYIEKEIRKLEQKERTDRYLNELNKISSIESEIKTIDIDAHVLLSYKNIRSTMIKDSYDSITEQDIDFLKEFIKFSEEFKTSFVDKEIDVKFNNNDKKIKELANLYCKDILPIYQKEITNPSRVFSEISDFNSLTNDYEVAIKKQEDLINYLTKREIIANKETSFYPKNTNYQHLVKFYEDYKKSFDFSWGNNGDWLNRLNEFEDNQNEYIRCISLLQQVEEKDIAIIEESKKLKRIKKVYLEYKESLNFETIPHIDKNKSLVEFIDFQTKVLNNIKSKGEEVNDSLKKAKELKDKIEVLTK